MRIALALVMVLASGISVAEKRYAIDAFEGDGYSCTQAVFRAGLDCEFKLAEQIKDYEVLEPPVCPKNSCSCYGGQPIAHAICPAKALIEDGQEYSNTGDFEMKRYAGQGLGCWQATHNARTKMYRDAARISRDQVVVAFQLDASYECFCDYRPVATSVCTGWYQIARND